MGCGSSLSSALPRPAPRVPHMHQVGFSALHLSPPVREESPIPKHRALWAPPPAAIAATWGSLGPRPRSQENKERRKTGFPHSEWAPGAPILLHEPRPELLLCLLHLFAPTPGPEAVFGAPEHWQGRRYHYQPGDTSGSALLQAVCRDLLFRAPGAAPCPCQGGQWWSAGQSGCDRSTLPRARPTQAGLKAGFWWDCVILSLAAFVSSSGWPISGETPKGSGVSLCLGQ